MMKIFERILCFLLSLVFFVVKPCFCMAIDALPGETSNPLSIGSFIDLIEFGREAVQEDLPKLRNIYLGLINDNICRRNPTFEGRHHFLEQHTQVDGQVGHYYICEYCGKSAGEVLDEAQAEYVATLPASTVTSDGGFYWYATVDDVYSDNFYVNFPSSGHTSVEKSNNWSFYSSGLSFQKYNDNSFTYLFSGNNYSFKLGFNALSFRFIILVCRFLCLLGLILLVLI